MKNHFEYWVSSYNAFMIHIKNPSHIKKLKSESLDEWYKKSGWMELKALEKRYPLDKFNLIKYGKTFKGYDYDSSEYCTCIEFKIVKKEVVE